MGLTASMQRNDSRIFFGYLLCNVTINYVITYISWFLKREKRQLSVHTHLFGSIKSYPSVAVEHKYLESKKEILTGTHDWGRVLFAVLCCSNFSVRS